MTVTSKVMNGLARSHIIDGLEADTSVYEITVVSINSAGYSLESNTKNTRTLLPLCMFSAFVCMLFYLLFALFSNIRHSEHRCHLILYSNGSSHCFLRFKDKVSSLYLLIVSLNHCGILFYRLLSDISPKTWQLVMTDQFV